MGGCATPGVVARPGAWIQHGMRRAAMQDALRLSHVAEARPGRHDSGGGNVF